MKQILFISMLFGLFFSATSRGEADLSLECTNKELAKIFSTNDLSQIENNLEALEAANVYHLPCKTLKVGQSRILSLPTAISPSGMEHYYKLTKTGENEFEAALDLRFRLPPLAKNAKPNAPTSESNLQSEMKKKVNQCLSIANKALLGANGEKLHIRIAEENEPKPKPPAVKISIAPSSLSIHSSRRYTKDISCSEITHELLHLMGLVDEYSEERFGYERDPTTGALHFAVGAADKAAYDCRAIGKNNSIMSSHDEAFSSVFNYWDIPTIIKCSCDEPNLCKKMIDKFKSTSSDTCPDSTSISYYGRFEDSDFDKYSNDGNFYDNENQVIVMARGFTPSKGKSLLLPAHFSAITQPGCKQNFPYYQCSIEAYQTSKEHGGNGCLMNPVPTNCRRNGPHWQKAN